MYKFIYFVQMIKKLSSTLQYFMNETFNFKQHPGVIYSEIS